MVVTEEDELLDAMAGVPSEFDAALDSQVSTARRQAITDNKIARMAESLPQVSSPDSSGPYVNAKTTDEAYGYLPSSAMPEQSPPQRGGFDWARALTALGGGDVGSLDSNRRWQSGQGERDLDMQVKRQGLLAKQQEIQEAQRSKRALVDPSSPESQEARSMFKDYALGVSNADGIPQKLADQLRAAAQSSGNMNAAQIYKLKSNYDAMMPNIIKFGESGRKSAHDVEMAELRRLQIEASKGNAEAMRALANARFTETKEENRRKKEDKDAKDAEKEAELYGKDIAPLNENEALMTGVSQLKGSDPSKPKVNTGQLASRLQKARQFFGFKDDDWDTMEGRLAAVNNQIIKLQAGGNVTGDEARRMQQQMPDMTKDDDEFNAKLATVMEQIALKKQQVNKKHPKTSGVNQPPSVEQKSKADKARRALANDSGATESQRRGAEAYLRSIGQM